MSDVNLEGLRGCMCTNAGRICPTKEEEMTEKAKDIMEEITSGKRELSEDDVIQVLNTRYGRKMLDKYLLNLGIDMQRTHPNCCTSEQLNCWLLDKKSGYPQLISLLANYLKNDEGVEIKFLVEFYREWAPFEELHYGELDVTLPLITINSVLTEKGRNPIKPGEQISEEDLERALSYVRNTMTTYLDGLYGLIGKVAFSDNSSLVSIEKPIFDRNLQCFPSDQASLMPRLPAGLGTRI